MHLLQMNLKASFNKCQLGPGDVVDFGPNVFGAPVTARSMEVTNTGLFPFSFAVRLPDAPVTSFQVRACQCKFFLALLQNLAFLQIASSLCLPILTARYTWSLDADHQDKESIIKQRDMYGMFKPFTVSRKSADLLL